METGQFAGATKTSSSFLSPLEKRLGRVVLPRIPAWLETYHLTWLTLLWSALVLVFSGMAARDLRWLWGASAMICLQWATDHFDGKIGKLRGTGLVKWGFYMDHLLDYVFLCSVLVGYALILPERSALHLLAVLALFGGFM
ncbi:MAG TPA: CDP-alcohol phosphatidyltransferase family protein, partial [Pyrinomonadaceae bacterium]|nr:CDP-alcohol phosphatidyltransferase family protein [Pyrinomonadaceae bacterium]